MDVPVASRMPSVKITDVKGMDRLTAASACSPTPQETNMPSTMVYREKIHMDTMDGITNWKKRLIRFKGMTSLFPFYHKPSYHTRVKRRRQKR